MASVAGKETVQDDPFGQQIHNLKQFIQQAKAAGKHDDALNLEANLREIQEEYRKRKIEEQKELRQNYEEFKDLFSKPAGKIFTSNNGICLHFLTNVRAARSAFFRQIITRFF